jgi:hypothetical protein
MILLRRGVTFAAALTFVVAGCDDVVGPYVPAAEVGRVQVAFGASLAAWSADPMTVDSALIENDRLHVFARHGGGCRDHAFAAVVIDHWLESEPVQVNLYVAHESYADPCRALLTAELRFDLTPLRQAYRHAFGARPGELILRVTQAAASNHAPVLVTYRFQAAL